MSVLRKLAVADQYEAVTYTGEDFTGFLQWLRGIPQPQVESDQYKALVKHGSITFLPRFGNDRKPRETDTVIGHLMGRDAVIRNNNDATDLPV